MENFNIISNNCVGARYYEKKSFFPNPFMWNSTKLNDSIEKFIKWWKEEYE